MTLISWTIWSLSEKYVVVRVSICLSLSLFVSLSLLSPYLSISKHKYRINVLCVNEQWPQLGCYVSKCQFCCAFPLGFLARHWNNVIIATTLKLFNSKFGCMKKSSNVLNFCITRRHWIVKIRTILGVEESDMLTNIWHHIGPLLRCPPTPAFHDSAIDVT